MVEVGIDLLRLSSPIPADQILSRNFKSQILNVSTDGEAAPSRGNLFQGLTTLTAKQNKLKPKKQTLKKKKEKKSVLSFSETRSMLQRGMHICHRKTVKCACISSMQDREQQYDTMWTWVFLKINKITECLYISPVILTNGHAVGCKGPKYIDLKNEHIKRWSYSET